MLVTGGWSIANQVDGVFNPFSLWTTERYDPVTGEWARAENLPSGRCQHRALLLRSGEVLVAGGKDNACADAGFQNAVVYNPIARTWTPTGPMTTGRWAFGATLLPDGRVLVTGGVGSRTTHTFKALRTAEIYDPETCRWV